MFYEHDTQNQALHKTFIRIRHERRKDAEEIQLIKKNISSVFILRNFCITKNYNSFVLCFSCSSFSILTCFYLD